MARRESHRFLLTYRKEVSEDAGASTVWRGWVVHVPDNMKLATSRPEPVWFHSLEEVPALLRRLIDG